MILRRASTLSRPLVLRPTYSARVCYYHPPEVHSNKGEEFFIPPSYPDNLEDSPSLVQKRDESAQNPAHWDEIHATSSEISVKADRGDINIQQQQKQQRVTRDLDNNLGEEEPPKLDEM
ncbi:hypothetical protein AAWM_08869 [Aspergillus awamori]|jgi:hypothetical protein|uniref:Uncharacterized protein n=3 Tax=Aspergillus TaxID=5052 RepID=A0A3F3PV17_9EURO|nr:hypothetical protein BDQ94DRAFT_148378 [Aspergillus welwitschiae]KAI2814368.1 hypothetical protein CBS115989_8633 [Aspergillus niger]RDH18654.1 hypothetical protein M747DRAFT_332673 [Aspergillus niger ATCC 13496]GCB25984.1 hypothetical protein AAWM_08869 [Aspergillus awamori]KAI2827824.1 hypothetical protein CBS133816_6085 [Aspergillus niger]KAI2837259.1 hypothetical protein CBS11350_8882 [Aspergillus niger]|eukprot:XP_001389851.2 hypothetical protein ANI_1_3368014 [Aspergillus niger CBS 513.88]